MPHPPTATLRTLQAHCGQRITILTHAGRRITSTGHRPSSSSRLFSSLSTALSKGAKIDVHPEIQHALANNQPVVALETALVTNGLPQPTNLLVGQSLEQIVRSTGAIPATIGFIGGRVKIGLQSHELERLADREGNPGVVKVSRRDIAPVMVKGLDGGTTCSSTLIFAAMAGIKVFATGGLGGVHRNGENTLDISADLQELSRCPVGLVSSGVKSILDIGKTLEYLETLGVPVLPYQSPGNEFPAFFTPKSGFKLPFGVNDPPEAAHIIHTHHTLGLPHGQLIAVPIPSGPSSTSPTDISSQGGLLHQTTSSTASLTSSPSLSPSASNGGEGEDTLGLGETVQRMVEQVIRESEENGVSRRGKEVTPWLLGRVAELSGGRSVQLNIKLLERTALVGGQIAVEYAKLTQYDNVSTSHIWTPSTSSSPPPPPGGPTTSAPTPALSTPITTQESPSSAKLSEAQLQPKSKAKIIIAGCSAVDVISKCAPSSAVSSRSTTPGSVSLTLGGVARNVAEACHRISSSGSLGAPSQEDDATLLISPVGDDAFGRLIVEEMRRRVGMRVDGVMVMPSSSSSTSSATSASDAAAAAAVGSGATVGAKTAVCNMVLDANGDLIGGVADMDIVGGLGAEDIIPGIEANEPSLVCLDANLSEETIRGVVGYCNKRMPGTEIFFEPTSIPKSTRILRSLSLLNNRTGKAPIAYISPNTLELKHIYQTARSNGLLDSPEWWETLEGFSLGESWRRDLGALARMPVSMSSGSSVDGDKAKADTLGFLIQEGVAQMAVHLLPFFQHILIKCGSSGVIAVFRSSSSSPISQERSNPHKRMVVSSSSFSSPTSKETVVLWHFPALLVEEKDIINVTGAGDTFVGAVLAGLARDPRTFEDADKVEMLMRQAQGAAVLTLGSEFSVSPLLGTGGLGAGDS